MPFDSCKYVVRFQPIQPVGGVLSAFGPIQPVGGGGGGGGGGAGGAVAFGQHNQYQVSVLSADSTSARWRLSYGGAMALHALSRQSLPVNNCIISLLTHIHTHTHTH